MALECSCRASLTLFGLYAGMITEARTLSAFNSGDANDRANPFCETCPSRTFISRFCQSMTMYLNAQSCVLNEQVRLPSSCGHGHVAITPEFLRGQCQSIATALNLNFSTSLMCLNSLDWTCQTFRMTSNDHSFAQWERWTSQACAFVASSSTRVNTASQMSGGSLISS